MDTEKSTAPQWVIDLVENQKKLMATNEELKTKLEALEKDNSMFRDIAGQNQIKSWEESKKDLTLKFAHLKSWNGKLIVAWEKLDMSKRNPYAKDATGENIFIPVVFQDGTKESLNYSDFTNIKDLVQVKLLEPVHQGTSTVPVEFPDGTRFTLESKYLNA